MRLVGGVGAPQQLLLGMLCASLISKGSHESCIPVTVTVCGVRGNVVAVKLTADLQVLSTLGKHTMRAVLLPHQRGGQKACIVMACTCLCALISIHHPASVISRWAQCNGIRVRDPCTHGKTHMMCCCVALVQRWGYQDLQPWQDALIKQVEDGPLALLLEKVQGTTPS